MTFLGKVLRAAAPLAALLALGGCILQPGKFDSTLDLRSDGTFTYSYKGQIYLLAMSQLAQMASEAEASAAEFTVEPCWDEDFEERDCTEEELAQQRSEWEGERERKAAEGERNAQMMGELLGGIDPADPEAAQELADRLARQAGWNAVSYSGDGLFEVDFAITSRMAHDFIFPTFERFPMLNQFVVANLRKDGAVRIDAPGFVAQGGDNPMQGMMGGMAAMFAAAGDESDESSPAVPQIDGTFRVVTDGEILANNTDEGPRETERGRVLEWKVNKRTTAAPMTLVRLAR